MAGVEFQMYSVKAFRQLEVCSTAFCTDELFQVFSLCPFTEFGHFNQRDSVRAAKLASSSVVLLLFVKALLGFCFGLIAKADGLIVLRAVVFNGKLERLAISIEYKVATTDASNTRERDLLE